MSEPVRVTQILDYFKEPWYIDWVCRVGKAEANRTGKRAMKVGSRVDELIKMNGKPVAKDSDEVKLCYSAFEKWRAIYQPKEVVNGTRMNNVIEGIAVTGEPDIFVDGVLVDIKCAGKISPKYWIQVNVYRELTKLCRKDVPEKVAILRLDKKIGSYEYVVKDHDKSLVDVWVGMARAYMYLKGEEDGAEL